VLAAGEAQCREKLNIAAYLGLRGDWGYHVSSMGQGGFLMTPKLNNTARANTCRAVKDGVQYRYVRVWKVANNKFCGDMTRSVGSNGHTRTPNPKPKAVRTAKSEPVLRKMTYTFTRDPMDRFVSGYTEVVFRGGFAPGETGPPRCSL